MTEVVKRESAALAEQREPSALEIIALAARDPAVDVAKLQALLDMKMRLEASDAEKAFNAAMSRLQLTLPRIIKARVITAKGGGVRSRYANLEDIDAIVRPLMVAEGLSASYDTEPVGQKETRVTCIIRHIGGHKERYSVVMPFDSSEYRTNAQNQGSTISYGQRRALCNALNIVTVGGDNDGQGSYLSQEQADKIRDLITAATGDMEDEAQVQSNFLKHMQAKAVSEILAGDFQKAVKVLEDRGRRMRGAK